ncbi:SOS response-associated peptidase [Salinigranum halophilum]|uniref:SOS response-associated peptidase n=1 Tax=Salinigranum halophilum TaxID=2565931 RepID=UPI0010A8D59C|nr:SOS response-associated peptidase [Salinigranum halophilum]
MCGRYTLFTPQARLEERFDAPFARDVAPRYNCAPGQELPVLTGETPDEFGFKTWGLIPSWADDDSTSFINARAETVREKRSFAEPFESRRCLVPADGFYEWVDRDGTKQPYRVAYEDDRPFAMAGLWERWTPPTRQTGLGEFGTSGSGETEPIETFTVVTTAPNGVVADLHHRMAVVLAPGEEETWLHGDEAEALELLDPAPDEGWEAYPVSTAVNSPANDAPELVEAVE